MLVLALALLALIVDVVVDNVRKARETALSSKDPANDFGFSHGNDGDDALL